MPRVFIKGNHKALPESADYKSAEKIGYELSKRGFIIVSSVQKGISEAAFAGAIRGNDNSKRIAIDCKEVDLPRNSKYTEVIVADNYFDMKMKKCINSNSFIFFAGGFGILSDIAIILHLKELKLMGNKLVICVGEQLEEALSAYSFYNEDVIDWFQQIVFVDDADEAIQKTLDFFDKQQ